MTALIDQLITWTRDQVRDKWLRSYSIRNPGADTSEGSLPYIDASTYADAAFPIYANAKTIALAAALAGQSTEDLTTTGTANGIPNPAGNPASGSVGFVTATTSAGGARIVGDDLLGRGNGLELKTDSGIRVTAQVSSIVSSGQAFAVASVDTGPSANLPAGTRLTVTNPPLGLQPTLYVAADSKGNGLTGGAVAETDAQRVARFTDYLAHPPSAGNDAAYQAFVEGLPYGIQKCFTWPAIDGPGTTGIAFTMQPGTGQSRAPGTAVLALVAGQLAGNFPGDDGQFVFFLLSQLLPLALSVRWTKSAAGWTDPVPWPTPAGGELPVVSTSGGVAATGCRVSYATGATGYVAPAVGQTIAFFDPASQTFMAKRISATTGAAPNAFEAVAWNLTFDTSASAASAAYVPIVGQMVGPWSDSLASLAAPVVSYFQNTGPGELFNLPFDDGERRLRQPEPPEWPSTLDTASLAPENQLAGIASVTPITPTLPFTTPIGAPPTYGYILELGDLAAYPG